MRQLPNVQRPALVVCDLQNDLLENEGWFNRSAGRKYKPEEKADFFNNCGELVDAARVRRIPIIYLCTVLRQDGLDFAFSPKLQESFLRHPYLVEGEWGSEIVAALSPKEDDIVIKKTGDSPFDITPFHRVLKNLNVDSIVMVGGPAYGSVNATGRDAAAHGYVAFAVPEALYPIGFDKPQLLRMRTHTISKREALCIFDRFQVEKPNSLKRQWTSLIPKSCLLMIDLQNGFVKKEGFLAGSSELLPGFSFDELAYGELLGNNQRLVNWARAARIPVINVRTVNRKDEADNALYVDAQFSEKPVQLRCTEGDWNADYAKEILPGEGDIPLIKHGHSAFKFTILDRMLVNLGVKQCIVTGGNIAGCLEETLRDGCALGYSMITVGDAAYRPGDERIYLLDNEVEVVPTREVVTLNIAAERAVGAFPHE